MSAVKATTLVRELIARGFSPAEALAIEAGEKPKASSSAAPAAQPKAETPAWIVQHAERKAARRALASSMRAQGIEPTGAAWKKAKREAKIV